MKIDPSEACLDKYCKGCLYYAKATKSCDYIFIVDHSRPCPPGKDCTERMSGRRKNPGAQACRKKGKKKNE